MILHLVTDRLRLANGRDDRACLMRQVLWAIAAGVDVVQVRERDLEARELAALVSDIVRAAEGTATRVVVNDRVDVAIGCGAAGVHLRGDSIEPALVRRIAPAGFLIGRSVHSVEEARRVASAVDYLIAGTVWPTPSKPPDSELLGVEGLRAVAAAVAVPVLAIGGVTVARAADIPRAGAGGLAAIGLFQPGAEAECHAAPLTNLVAGLRRTV